MSVNIDTEAANIPLVMFTEQGSDPTAPSAGYAAAYIKSGILYVRNSSGIWSPATNPMTTQDDLVVGGASGVEARLGKGSDGQVLTVDPTTHHLVWATPAAAGSVATDAIWDADGDLAVGSGANTAARLAKGADGDLLSVDPADHTVKWMAPGGAGALTLIDEHEAGAGGEASYTFPSISGSYRHLKLIGAARGTNVNPSINLTLQFNADTGTNYYHSYLLTAISGSSVTSASGVTSMLAGILPAAGGDAGNFARFEIDIFYYANTHFRKEMFSRAWGLLGGASPYTQGIISFGAWYDTSAITAIKLLPSADNLAQYSIYSLYGVT